MFLEVDERIGWIVAVGALGAGEGFEQESARDRKSDQDQPGGGSATLPHGISLLGVVP